MHHVLNIRSNIVNSGNKKSDENMCKIEVQQLDDVSKFGPLTSNKYELTFELPNFVLNQEIFLGKIWRIWSENVWVMIGFFKRHLINTFFMYRYSGLRIHTVHGLKSEKKCNLEKTHQVSKYMAWFRYQLIHLHTHDLLHFFAIFGPM